MTFPFLQATTQPKLVIFFHWLSYHEYIPNFPTLGKSPLHIIKRLSYSIVQSLLSANLWAALVWTESSPALCTACSWELPSPLSQGLPSPLPCVEYSFSRISCLSHFGLLLCLVEYKLSNFLRGKIIWLKISLSTQMLNRQIDYKNLGWKSCFFKFPKTLLHFILASSVVTENFHGSSS